MDKFNLIWFKLKFGLSIVLGTMLLLTRTADEVDIRFLGFGVTLNFIFGVVGLFIIILAFIDYKQTIFKR